MNTKDKSAYNNPNEEGRIVSELMERKGLSQAEVARGTGLDPATVCKLRQGKAVFNYILVLPFLVEAGVFTSREEAIAKSKKIARRASSEWQRIILLVVEVACDKVGLFASVHTEADTDDDTHLAPTIPQLQARIKELEDENKDFRSFFQKNRRGILDLQRKGRRL